MLFKFNNNFLQIYIWKNWIFGHRWWKRFVMHVALLCDGWLGLALCGLWQGLRGLVQQQLLKCDKLADSGQGESRRDRKPLSRVSSAKQIWTYCLGIHFRLPPFPSYRLGLLASPNWPFSLHFDTGVLHAHLLHWAPGLQG